MSNEMPTPAGAAGMRMKTQPTNDERNTHLTMPVAAMLPKQFEDVNYWMPGVSPR